MLKKIFVFLVLSTFLWPIAGCEKGTDSVSGKPELNQVKKKRSLILYNWADYIGSNTLTNFENETGIHVTLLTYDREDAMLGRLQSDFGQFDLVVISGATLWELGMAKLLEPLSYDKIPNFKYINEEFLHRNWDPNQLYTVPYLSGTTGVIVNTKFIQVYEPSWQLLFDKRYGKRMAFLNEPFEALGAISKALGYSLNETNSEALLHIKQKVGEIGPGLHGFHVLERIMELIRSEEVWASQIYSGEAMALVEENEDLEYFIPEEGAALWVDMFFMPRGAKNKGEAHEFLNYLLRPEVNAAIASELWYATANKAAEQFVDPSVLASPSVYPPADVRQRLEMFGDIGKATKEYNKMWSELKMALKKK